jgi:hypothetical protein
MSDERQPMRRRKGVSTRRELRARAATATFPPIPLVHVTSTGFASEIVESKQFEPQKCRVFGPKLTYFFALRPAYSRKGGDRKSHQINRFPFVFILRPDAVPAPFHVYPFDTGGAADGYFAHEADDAVCLEDYELKPDHEAVAGQIAWAFGTLEAYFDGTLRLDLMADVPVHETVTRGFNDIARMANVRSSNQEPDQRASAIELAANHNIPLKGNVLFAVLPRQYLEDAGIPNDDFIARLKAEGISWDTYEWQANMMPNEFQEEISRVVRRYYNEELKILSDG